MKKKMAAYLHMKPSTFFFFFSIFISHNSGISGIKGAYKPCEGDLKNDSYLCHLPSFVRGLKATSEVRFGTSLNASFGSAYAFTNAMHCRMLHLANRRVACHTCFEDDAVAKRAWNT